MACDWRDTAMSPNFCPPSPMKRQTADRGIGWRQRSRWLKGFMITYFVHMRAPIQLIKDIGFLRFMGLQTIFLASFSQFALAPLLWSFWLTVFGVEHAGPHLLRANRSVRDHGFVHHIRSVEHRNGHGCRVRARASPPHRRGCRQCQSISCSGRSPVTKRSMKWWRTRFIGTKPNTAFHSAQTMRNRTPCPKVTLPLRAALHPVSDGS